MGGGGDCGGGGDWGGGLGAGDWGAGDWGGWGGVNSSYNNDQTRKT